MADKQPSTAKLTEPTDAQQKNGETKEEVKKLPQLGALEDDDEFEEFPADAGNGATIADALQKGASGDSLWEAGWDDEDIEDDFAKKLRDTIEKKNASGGDQAMQ